MSFVQFTLVISKEASDACADLLTELGALAVSFEDAEDEPLFELKPGESPLWKRIKVIGLFENTISSLKVQSSLKHQLDKSIFETLVIESLQDQDWVRLSLDQFKPQQFGEHLWVCPTWCEVPAQDRNSETVVVTLDPGFAFGTGTHPTTQLCLEWLSNHSLQNKVVFDYGCGSGILGIAAAKLGAEEVLAIDHDPQAVLSTEENARLNEIPSTQLKVMMVDTFLKYLKEQNVAKPISVEDLDVSEMEMQPKADILLANILADPLIQLASQFARLVKTSGDIILSGILSHQVDAICAAYQPDFRDFSVVISGDWARISGVRK